MLKSIVSRNNSLLAKRGVSVSPVRNTTYPTFKKTYATSCLSSTSASVVKYSRNEGSNTYYAATLASSTARRGASSSGLSKYPIGKNGFTVYNMGQKPTVVISSDNDEVETVGDHIRV